MTFDSRDAGADRRKPRVALMGEFSAGKTTFANLLMGEEVLPTRVTATQLPPVWLTEGEGPALRVDAEGQAHPLTDGFGAAEVAEAHHLRVRRRTEILSLCDLIDMPGISDPNMDPAVWQRLTDEVDAVVWCSAATQAWRQSEAAVWSELSDRFGARSLLLLTRMDKILRPDDRDRVLRRIVRETEGQFVGVYPVSLLAALRAGDDRAAWEASGADRAVSDLLTVVSGLRADMAEPPVDPEGEPAAEAEEATRASEPAAAASEALPAGRPARPTSVRQGRFPVAATPRPVSAPEGPPRTKPGAAADAVAPRRVTPRRRSSRESPGVAKLNLG